MQESIVQETADCDTPHHQYSCPPCLAPVFSSPGDEHFVKKARKIRGRTRKDEFWVLVQMYRVLHRGSISCMWFHPLLQASK